MTLDEATKAFEGRFERVIEFESGHLPAAIAPNGVPYKVFATGIEKKEGAHAHPRAIGSPKPSVIRDFHQRMMKKRLNGAKTLYWRCRPEWSEEGSRCYIYCRLAMGK
ncbi:MAG TPA: hypothetical protein VGG45_16225 [Terracidiphilus sp.]|jgi:hypothetical protein